MTALYPRIRGADVLLFVMVLRNLPLPPHVRG